MAPFLSRVMFNKYTQSRNSVHLTSWPSKTGKRFCLLRAQENTNLPLWQHLLSLTPAELSLAGGLFTQRKRSRNFKLSTPVASE